ncbi:MAG: type II toxin-antitoxin system VapC family toxin [Dehalococcoidia bacterium]|nr:type II toxin-antitoxin system VapC family toxin [Chloroflexota bacterium]MXW27159.1 type II toxin-antitoxin system VapC family toxin [Dehalococcoidia bacterium]MYA53964.1 type II toxin-antitoxin system VapC family toxin [Dehalococcoidia bacterium]
MKILLDANAYRLSVEGDPQVSELVRGAEEVILSVIVLGELLYGFRWGTHFEANMERLQSFLQAPHTSVVEVGPATSDRYGRIASALRAKGRPIPTNDIWIAAHAMETGADLVSADSHFEHVDDLAWTRVVAG